MLLANRVELLRKNLAEIETITCVLPMWSGDKDTRTAYHFAYLVLPARDIMTTVHAADPNGSILPAHLRGWDIAASDEHKKQTKVPLKKFLGMIIHMHYLQYDQDVDVANDCNKRFIVTRDVFLKNTKRLLLSYPDICLVTCARVEKACNGKGDERSPWEPEGSGFRDLQKILRDIAVRPELGALNEVIWNSYFDKQKQTIESDADMMNDVPCIKETRSLPRIAWRIKWRKGCHYSDSWIDVLSIVSTIRDYFQRQ